MNQKLLIALAVAAVALIIYLLWRSSKRMEITQPAPIAPVGRAAPIVVPRTASPGVSLNSGTVPNNPPPPPPPDITAKIRTAIKPTGPLQMIPVVGGTASSIVSRTTRAPLDIFNKTNAVVTSSIEHIPVAGKALAAPLKVANKITKSAHSAISSLF